MPDFNALLNADPTTFERPPTIPEGEYLAVIKSREFGKSAKKQTPFVRFHYGILQALDSVPEEALADIELSKAEASGRLLLHQGRYVSASGVLRDGGRCETSEQGCD